MYLPLEIPQAKVLVAVKTYPNPSSKYDELVCTAGFVDVGENVSKWIRVYPVRFRHLPYSQQFRKYDWIELNLVRKRGDLRRESYSPKLGVEEEIRTIGSVGTGKDGIWRERRQYALREVYDSMNELIGKAKEDQNWQSLATLKPREFVGFDVEEVDRDWDPKFSRDLRQQNLFEKIDSRYDSKIEVVRKVPYRYYYSFLTEGDNRPRKLMIEDWEISALYWNCLASAEGDERIANELVRQKYEDEILKRDVYLFVGTTLANHIKAPNPFVIVGVFWPPYIEQPELPFDL